LAVSSLDPTPIVTQPDGAMRIQKKGMLQYYH
jgi:hypothetical protein